MDQLQRIFPIQYALVAVIVGAVVTLAIYRRRRRRRSDVRTSAVQAIAGGGITFGLVLTASITLLNFTGTATGSDFVDLGLVVPPFAQALVNLLLFWWVALLVPLVRRIGVAATTALTFAASVVTEVLQWLLPTGRSAALMDLILNTAGGFGFALLAVYLVRPMVTRWSSARAS